MAGEKREGESGSAGQTGGSGPGENMQQTGAGGSMGSEGTAGSTGQNPEEESMSSMQSGGNAAQLQQYLRSVNYPAEKQDMIDAARSNNAPEDFMSFMNKLPDKTYNAPAEVEEEFGKIK